MKKISILLLTVVIFSISAFTTISVNAGEIDFHSTGTTTENTTENKNEKALSESITSGNLPSRYSSLDSGYVTSVKEQMGSICWAYSGLATFESLLLKNNLFTGDLNIDHIDNWATPRENGDGWQRNLYEQGYGYITMGYLTSWIGPFTDDETKVNIGTTAIRYINKNNPTEIKTAIMKNGAVTGDYNSINDGNNSDRTAFFTTKNSLTIAGHSISVIGWDDNFSRENFDGRYTPKSDGAWLCKNSWAEYNSLGGYFWISYEDFYLFNDDIFATSYAIEDYQIIEENHSLYQNEEFGATYEFDYVEDTENVIYMSKFDFSQKGNVLDKVVFETESLGADYTVYYVPVKNNFPVSDKKKWYTLDTGKVDYRGYICCDFEDMIISQSQGVIAIEIDTSEINKGIDSSKSNYTKNTIGVAEWLRSSSTKEIIFTQQSQAGECYISYDGTTMDLYDFYVKTFGDRVGGTFAIKTITNDTKDTTISGDINFDQKIDINDATYLQKHLASIVYSLMEHQEINADFNKDGKLNIKDVTAIQRYIANISQPTEQPTEQPTSTSILTQ